MLLLKLGVGLTQANEDATLLASAYVKARQAALEELQTGVQAGHGAAAENIGIRVRNAVQPLQVFGRNPSSRLRKLTA